MNLANLYSLVSPKPRAYANLYITLQRVGGEGEDFSPASPLAFFWKPLRVSAPFLQLLKRVNDEINDAALANNNLCGCCLAGSQGKTFAGRRNTSLIQLDFQVPSSSRVA